MMGRAVRSPSGGGGMAGYRVLGWLLALRAAAALADVGDAVPPPGGGPGVLTVPGVSRRAPATGAPVDAAVAGLGRFADQFRRAVLQPGYNRVFSPLSIGYAFAMLRAAAGGNTATQLDQGFGFPVGGVDEGYNALSRQLGANGTPHPVTEPGPPAEAEAPAAGPTG